MLSKDMKEVTWEHIEALVAEGVSEGKEIEFKQVLPGKTDTDKNEFLADVTAFANAGGGHIIYGIRAEEGIAKEVVGLTDSVDDAVLRLDNILRDCVEPRLLGVSMESFKSDADKVVLLMHVPMSWTGPHQIRGKGNFHVRNNGGKHMMDVSELRSAFAMSETATEKIRRFRDERLGRIMAGDAPVSLGSRAKLVLHIVPIASAHRDVELDVEQIADHSRYFYPLGNSGGNPRFNLDGFLMVARGAQSYCQVFRNGRVEGVTANMENDFQGGKGIPSSWCEEQVIEATTRYLVGLDTLGILYPMIIMVSVLGVRGYYMPQPYKENGIPIDRDTLILPDVVLKECPTRNGLPKALRPIFDALLNAGGFSGSSSYDSDGEWRP